MSLRTGEKRRLKLANEESSLQADQSKRVRLSHDSTDEQSEPEPQSQSMLSQSWLYHNQVERCGKIISMHLKNFMCHSNLSIEFGQRINFLVGSNGSGKSAVLTALVVALGGSARVTNRSTSVQKLIKSGETCAEIEIVLSNSGLLPFQPGIYGDRIIIVRNIKSNGGSSYFLKNANGNVVSRHLDDLRRLITYFNIRTDNPIFVLNQDAAREFLKDLEPSKNYQLFLKASQLDIITLSLHDCQNMRREQLDKLKALKEKIRLNKSSIAELQEKLEMLKSIEEMKQEVEQLDLALAWCSVKKYQSQLDEIELKINTVEKRKSELEKFTHNKDNVQQDYNQMLSKYQEKKFLLRKKYQEKELVINDTRKRSQCCKERVNALQSNLRTYAKHIVHLQQDLSDLKSHMDTCEDDKRKAETLLQQNLASKQSLQGESQNINVISEKIKRELNTLNERKIQLTEKFNEAKQLCTTLISSINKIKGQISVLQANGRNKLSIFGEEVVALVRDIETLHRENRFSVMPRGPVGQYIEVPNAKYRDLIENHVRHLLGAFVVASVEDRKTLNDLINRKYPRFRGPVITTRFSKEVYDVKQGSVQTPANTRLLMDEIICKDPVVMNFLIDTVRIETQLITENKETAEYLTSELENVPPNLSSIFVPNLGLQYMAAPNYAMYSRQLGPAKIIQVNVNERIEQLEAERYKVEHNLEQKTKIFKEIKQSLIQNEVLIKEKRTEIESNEKKLFDIEQKISELENYDYPAQNDMDVLRKEYSEAEAKIERITEKLNREKDELAKAVEEKNQIEEELEKQKEELRGISANQQDIDSEEQQTQIKLRNLDYDISQNQKKIKSIEELLNSQMEQRTALKTQLERATQIARDKGDCLDTNDSEDQITQKIGKLKAKIKQRSELQIDANEVLSVLEGKIGVLDNDERTNNILKKSIEQLHSSWNKRFETLKRMREHAGLMVQFMFNNILKYRKFRGEINVDHRRKIIEIKVTPNSGNGMSNTRALSGGERSYTTVALLNALWSCSDHPFYFLDEYDVFTDDVNRDYITNTLIGEGKFHPSRQYCFLTPQDTKIAAQEFIKIHRLAEPLRGSSNTN